MNDYNGTCLAVEKARKLILPTFTPACRLRMLCDLSVPLIGIEYYNDPHCYDGEELLTSIDTERGPCCYCYDC